MTVAIDGLAQLKLPSVTTLIRDAMRESSGIGFWKVNQTATEALESHQQIGAMLQQGKRDAAYAWLQGASREAGRRGRERGTRFHNAVESVTLGQPPKLDDEIRPY